MGIPKPWTRYHYIESNPKLNQTHKLLSRQSYVKVELLIWENAVCLFIISASFLNSKKNFYQQMVFFMNQEPEL